MSKKLILITVILLITLSFNSCGVLTNSLDGFFAEWEPESDGCFAILSDTDRSMLFIDGNWVDVGKAVSGDGTNASIGELLAVVEDKVYGVLYRASDDGNYRYDVCIYLVDVYTEQMQILHQEPGLPYDSNMYCDGWDYHSFEQYYECQKIVVCDGATTIVYNINTGEVEYKPPEEFTYPVAQYTIEDKGEGLNFDFDRVVIINGEEKRTITVEYMAERHEYVRRLLELGKLKGFFGTIIDPLESFFYTPVVVGDKIYLICKVLEKDGGANGLVFSYDFKTDSFDFLYHQFFGDDVHLSVIPRE